MESQEVVSALKEFLIPYGSFASCAKTRKR